jgi:hypothetical protein
MVGFSVRIHHITNSADEPDDAFGVEVPRGSFSREKHSFSDELRALLRARPLQVAVTLDNCQCVEQLPLVSARGVSACGAGKRVRYSWILLICMSNMVVGSMSKPQVRFKYAASACFFENFTSSHFLWERVTSRTRCTPHVTRHTSHVTRHTSHVTHHTSHITRHTSHATHHTSHATRHTSHVTRHTSHITRHTSHVTRHLQLRILTLGFQLPEHLHVKLPLRAAHFLRHDYGFRVENFGGVEGTCVMRALSSLFACTIQRRCKGK